MTSILIGEFNTHKFWQKNMVYAHEVIDSRLEGYVIFSRVTVVTRDRKEHVKYFKSYEKAKAFYKEIQTKSISSYSNKKITVKKITVNDQVFDTFPSSLSIKELEEEREKDKDKKAYQDILEEF